MIRKYAEMFCWKNVSSFCSAKVTHIFSAKNIRILCTESAKIVNEMILNELVKLTTLWTTGIYILSLFFFFRFFSPIQLSLIYWKCGHFFFNLRVKCTRRMVINKARQTAKWLSANTHAMLMIWSFLTYRQKKQNYFKETILNLYQGP